MFGSQVPASTPAGGFSFGQQANTPATAKPNLTLQMPTASTSLFGQQPQQQQQKPGFGFAAPAANAPTTSTFGATQTANQPQPSLFGQAQQPNPSLFGQATQQPSTSLFGQSQQQSSMFGSQPQQQNTFGQSMFGQQQQQQQNIMTQAVSQQPQALDSLKYLNNCWDPKNPACQFKYYFYNLVHPSEVKMYQPAPGEDRILYDQALLDNPDPTCMVPVLATGFEGLKTRFEMQESQLAIHKEKIEEFKSRLQKLEQTHTVETMTKIEEFKVKQRQIAHKILQLMKNVQIVRNRGYSLRAEEEALMARLISMDRDLAKPSVFRGRINELYSQVQQQKDSNRLVIGAYGSGSENYGFQVQDPNSLRPVIQALEEMSKGLQQLTAVVNEDEEALNVVERGYQEGSLSLTRS